MTARHHSWEMPRVKLQSLAASLRSEGHPRAGAQSGGLHTARDVTWFAHEVSQLCLNVPLLLLQLLLLHPGRNHRSDELLPLHAPGLDPSHIVLKPHLCIADHLSMGELRKPSSIISVRFPSTQTH